MKQKHRLVSYFILALIVMGMGTAMFFLPNFKQLASPEFLRDYLRSLGPVGYFAYVIVVLLSIPLPIPSTAIAFAGGYVYGTFLGTALTLLGTALGSLMVFYIVRRLGRPLVEKLVDSHHIQHFLHIFKRRGETAALISYAIPVFPNDAVNIVLGLTRIRYPVFLALVIIGSIPRYLFVSALGGDLYAGFSWHSIIVIIFCTIFLLIAVFREKVKRFIFKELKELEQDVEEEVVKVEGKVKKMERKRPQRKKRSIS